MPQPEPETLRNLHVLIVDDNATTCRIVLEMLINWHMAPETADCAASALMAMEQARLAGKPFGLVLLDARLAEEDGFELARQVRDNLPRGGAAIMLLASDQHARDLAQCVALGFAGHVLKPIEQSDLFDAILIALNARLPMAEPAKEGPLQPRNGRGLRILLAEDNIVNQKVAGGILLKAGSYRRRGKQWHGSP